MNDIMLRDILSQGTVLSNCLKDFRACVAEWPVKTAANRILITGSGDSYIAGAAVARLYERHLRQPVRVLRSLDAGRYTDWQDGDLLIALSVSGEVTRTVEAAHSLNNADSVRITITANEQSTLARASDYLMKLPTPIDRTIPHSRDFTTMLTALGVTLEWLLQRRLPRLDQWVGDAADLINRALRWGGSLPSAPAMTWFLGAGPDRATAMYGAMKYWEAAGLKAWWDDLEEFAHGSQLMARPGDRIVALAAGGGVDRLTEMSPGFSRLGLHLLRVTPGAGASTDGSFVTWEHDVSEWHPFVACFPLQALAYHMATSRGWDVTRPLGGGAYGDVVDEVHRMWTKGADG